MGVGDKLWSECITLCRGVQDLLGDLWCEGGEETSPEESLTGNVSDFICPVDYPGSLSPKGARGLLNLSLTYRNAVLDEDDTMYRLLR